MSAIDTPDYQRGVANAQVLLASEPISSRLATVGIPPNAETLIVIVGANANQVPVVVQGVTSGIYYPGYPITQGFLAGIANYAWLFDVTNVVDEQVFVTLDGPSPTPWYVYADTGAHVVVEAATLRSKIGQPYTVPTPPSTAAGDHPPVELGWVSTILAGSSVFVGSPGAGRRWRVFAANLACFATGAQGYLTDAVSGEAFMGCGASNTVAMSYEPSGLPLSVNGAINYTASVNGAMLMSVVVTNEAL